MKYYISSENIYLDKNHGRGLE